MDPSRTGQVSPAAKRQKTENRSQDIKLQVGECQFMTTLEILNGSETLKNMFKSGGTRPAQITEDGFYFIDSDGEMFKYVLRYLRNKRLTFSDDFRESDLLLREAEYYKVQGLTDALQLASGKPETFIFTVMDPVPPIQKNKSNTQEMCLPTFVHMFLQKDKTALRNGRWQHFFRDQLEELNFTMFPYDYSDASPGLGDCNDVYIDERVWSGWILNFNAFITQRIRPDSNKNFPFKSCDETAEIKIIQALFKLGFTLTEDTAHTNNPIFFGKKFKSVRIRTFQRVKPICIT